MKIILATGSDINYLNKSVNYLLSVEKNSNFDINYLVFLGKEKVNCEFKKIKILNLFPENLSTKNSFKCVQEGNFLKSEGFDENVNNEDIIFFTDGDMTLQRPLHSDEIDMIKKFKDDDVYIGYNFSPNDNLYDEYFRLNPTGKISNTFSSDFKKIKCYNTGVIAMNKKTWKKLHNFYTEMFCDVDPMFNHYAKMQWLICYILATKNFNIIEMGYDIHNHTHAPSPIGTSIDKNGIVQYNNKIVLFKHKWT